MERLLRRIQYWLRARQADADLIEEIELHRRLTQENLEREGLPADEALYASRRALGNVTLAREDAAAAWIWPWIHSVRQDALYALRTMWRQPVFTIVAVGTLAAGIGLNTTVFNLYSAITMRPWPVREPRQIVTIYHLGRRDLRARAGGGPMGFSVAEMKYFEEHSKTFSGFIAIRSGGGDRTLGEDDTPASWVSGNYFTTLGIEMAAGRSFTPEEDRVESPVPVAVLSYGYWQRRFGGDPSLPGKTIQLEDVPFTVVGVASQSFTGTSADRVDIWMPISSAPLLRPDDSWVRNIAQKPENCCVSLAGRLVPSATREQALAELKVLDQRFRAGRDPDAGAVYLDGTQLNAGPRRGGPAFAAVFTGVMLVLLLACANVGNLLVARAASRRREIAVRLSLGASRARIVRQLVTESLALALVAGVVGLLAAGWLAQIVVPLVVSPTAVLRLEPDVGVLGYALLLSLLACILFGLAPALHATRQTVSTALKSNVPMVVARMPLRNLLLTIQVAVATVLLVAAGLLARAVYDASVRDLGFSMQDLSVVSFEAPPRGYDRSRIQAISLDLVNAMEALGGPGTIAMSSTEPLGSGYIKGSFSIPGVAGDQANSVYEVSPSYFDLLGLEIIAGRRLTASDVDKPVIVISETMARRYWTIPSAVGQRILVDPATGGWNRPGELEIVGVARDVHQTSLEEADSTIYQPLSGRQIPRIMLRSADAGVIAAVTDAAARVDPRLRARVRPISDNLTPRLSPSRIGATIAGGLGGLALMLASVGVLGVFSYWVQQRTQEIGIRMALGARSHQVVWLVFGSSARSLFAGAVFGIAGSIAASGLLRSYLFGLSPLDPFAYVVVVLLLGCAGALATYLPARRATRIDPVVALRCE